MISVAPHRTNAGGIASKKAGDPILHGDWNALAEAAFPQRSFKARKSKVDRHYDRVDFSWQYLTGASVRVHAGYFVIDGYLDYRIVTTDISLTGTPENVYLQYEWGAAVATIEHSSSRPVTNATFYRHPFLQFGATDGVYFPTEIYWEGGSVKLASPLRGAT